MPRPARALRPGQPRRRPRGADKRCPGTAPRARPAPRAAPWPEGRIPAVIATTSSGRRFAVLARYLMRGRSGEETARVAWTAGRNLGLDDPELAAVLMQAIADQNLRVEVPVYHLTINFDATDPVTPAEMQDVADRVLAGLRLAEHQALMVAHQDRAHPHVHLMGNPVHPETGVAWGRWQERPRIEGTPRGLERA